VPCVSCLESTAFPPALHALATWTVDIDGGMRAATGNEVLAGAIGATSVLGGAFTSPLLSPVVDLGSAAVTAGIAAHAVVLARGDGDYAGRESTRAALRRAASAALQSRDAPLAAHVLDAACRTRACDAKAARSVAMLVGRCFETHARGIVMGLLGGWLAPVKHASRALDAAKVAQAATANAEFLRAVTEAVSSNAGADARYELRWVPTFVVVTGTASEPEESREAA
jgi:hypothetical protein